MIYNTRKTEAHKVGLITVHIRPLTIVQHNKLMSLISSVETTQDLIEMTHFAMDCSLISTEGLTLDGIEVQPKRDANGSLSREFTDEQPKSFLDRMASLIVKAGGLDEDDAKK